MISEVATLGFGMGAGQPPSGKPGNGSFVRLSTIELSAGVALRRRRADHRRL
jgi:hypothetical protein